MTFRLITKFANHHDLLNALHFIGNSLKADLVLQIDFEKVAADMGLKNASTASARFGQIKRKLNELPFTPATIAAVQNSSPPVGTISGASATKGNKRKAPGLPGSAPKRARKSTTKTKPVKTTTNIKYEDDQEESSETNMGCSTGGRIAEDIDSAEESTEQGVKDIAGDEMEEEEKLAES